MAHTYRTVNDTIYVCVSLLLHAKLASGLVRYYKRQPFVLFYMLILCMQLIL